jgi:hypothetical protein
MKKNTQILYAEIATMQLVSVGKKLTFNKTTVV